MSVPVARALCSTIGGSPLGGSPLAACALSIISATAARLCSCVREKPWSKLKSVCADETHGKLQPMRRLRGEDERDVTSVQVRQHAVDGIGDRRIHRATGLVARAEHKVVDEQL